MAKQDVLIGQTDYSVLVFIPDSGSVDGSGKTGLVAANLTVSGVRVETDNDIVVTDYTGSLNDLAALTTAHTDWGWKEVSSTVAPGLYRLDIADAIFAAGAWSAVVYVMVTTSAAAASPMEFVIGDLTPYSGTLPANAITATSIAANAITDAKVASDVTIASVTGAVGSVTGAVGSVTGNVGGNVTGSVGSVVGAVGSVTAVSAGGITAASFAANALTASALAADAVDEILDEAIGDGTTTMRQALRVFYAALAGKVSGAETTEVTFRNRADSANVIVATVDASGNRTAVTVSP